MGTLEDAERVAAKVIEAVRTPFAHDGDALRINASIGISLYPQHGESLDELMRRADRAMYQVKARGEGGWWLASA